MSLQRGEESTRRPRDLTSPLQRRRMIGAGDLTWPLPVAAAVVDVGGDGDLDLVSVTSLFVPEGEVVVPRHRHQCSLQTRLRKRQLYGPHWRETLSRDALPGAGPQTTETMSQSVPTGDVPRLP